MSSTVRGVVAFLIAATMAAIAAGSWAWLNQPLNLPDAPPRISGFAYSGYQRHQDPNGTSLPTASELMVYQIRLGSHLSPQWTDWFQGMTVTPQANGDTLLVGPVVDQSALHGLIKKVRDLGLTLLAVNCLERLDSDVLSFSE